MKSKVEVSLINLPLSLKFCEMLRVNSCFIFYPLALLVMVMNFITTNSHAQIPYSDKVSDQELRSALNDYIKFAQPLLESSFIYPNNAHSHDQKNVLKAKIYCSAALNLSLFHEPPLYALLDTWILLNQIKTCPIVEKNEQFVANIDILILQLTDIYKYKATLLPFAKTKDFVESFAQSNTISCVDFYRHSPLSKIDAFFASENQGLFDKMTNIGEEIEVLSFKMNYWMEYLPKQMKWQMELLSYDLLEHKMGDSLSIESLMMASNNFMKDGRAFMTSSTSMMDSMDVVLNQVFDRQMYIFQKNLALERLSFLSGIHSETSWIMDTMIQHLNKWESLVSEMQSSTMEGMNNISSELLSTSSSGIDKLMKRLTYLVILFCTTLLAAALILRSKKN